jgi:hypothetical protein
VSIQIPVSFKEQSSDFELTIDLDLVPTTIRLIYNIRVNYWFGDFSTENNSIKRVKLVENTLILNQYKAILPDILGDFMILRISDELDKPILTYDNFGIDWGFFYLTPAEVETYKDDNGIV